MIITRELDKEFSSTSLYVSSIQETKMKKKTKKVLGVDELVHNIMERIAVKA